MARQSLEKEEFAHTVEINKPILQVSFRALTDTERRVLWCLFFSQGAKTGYSIYNVYVFSELSKQKGITPQQYNKVLNEHGNVELTAQHFNGVFAETGKPLNISSLSTVRRMLEDFVRIGWAGKRTIGKKQFYFIIEGTANELTKQLGWKAPVISP